MLSGPAGPLEALLELPGGDAPRGVAVICHPHPLFGGTLQNKVVYTLARAALALGFAALRFNFRGVGQSVGIHDGGGGETGDALAAIAQMRQKWPGLPLLLAGFSFGGAVAIRAAAEAQPALLVTVAPAVDRVGLEGLSPIRCPWLFVLGEADAEVDPARVRQWAGDHAPGAQIVGLPGVGHYFHGVLNQLQAAVVDFALQQGKKKPGN
jgi:alpha/beta superfamily hydrolase